MATLTESFYGKLFAKTRPRVITTESENERALAEVEALDDLALKRPLTPEEAVLAELLTVLIGKFEEEHYPLGTNTPLESLRNFMEFRGLRQRDRIPIFGASSTISAVMNCRRAISKAQAQRLADFFHAPMSLFI